MARRTPPKKDEQGRTYQVVDKVPSLGGGTPLPPKEIEDICEVKWDRKAKRWVFYDKTDPTRWSYAEVAYAKYGGEIRVLTPYWELT